MKKDDVPELEFVEKRSIRKWIKWIGLIRFLEEVADVCFHEGERVRLKWGDPQFAKVWARRAELIHRVAQSLREEELGDPRPINRAQTRPKRKLLEYLRIKRESSDIN